MPPPPVDRLHGRNSDWRHVNNADVLSHARQVGISLVRRLGPRLSLHPAGPDRRGVCQASAGAADSRMVHAPQRSASRLRVGIRRRQPAGPCLGRLARLSDRPQAARRQGRPGVSRTCLPQAAAQFHLVGQSQGRPGPQYFPGRLPGHGQRRRLRSLQAAADRRLPQPGRRHQLDGHVLPQHAAHRHSSSPCTIPFTRTSPPSSSSISWKSPRR